MMKRQSNSLNNAEIDNCMDVSNIIESVVFHTAVLHSVFSCPRTRRPL